MRWRSGDDDGATVAQRWRNGDERKLVGLAFLTEEEGFFLKGVLVMENGWNWWKKMDMYKMDGREGWKNGVEGGLETDALGGGGGLKKRVDLGGGFQVGWREVPSAGRGLAPDAGESGVGAEEEPGDGDRVAGLRPEVEGQERGGGRWRWGH